MKAQLKKVSELLPDLTTIYIVNENTDFNLITLNKSEKEFAIQRLKTDDYVEINSYYRWVFIYRPKTDTEKEFEELEKCRKKAYEIHQTLEKYKIDQLLIINETANKNFSISIIEGLLLSNYKFDKYLEDKSKENRVIIKDLLVYDEKIDQNELSEIKNLIEAVYLCRDLVNEPYNKLNSVKFSTIVYEILKDSKVEVNIHDKNWIEEMKMGGILAVNKASVDPPAFIELIYKPENRANENPIIIIGKGIMFDTGGINLKIEDAMQGMKADMSGAAIVFSVIYALQKNNIPIYTIGLMPLTDNKIGPNSILPGDIITMMDGTTVEIISSDAEGRLILADALAYAKKFQPFLVLDAATLTGSARAAIGKFASVAFSTANENIFNILKKISYYTNEKIVEFPLWDEYKELLKSEVATIKNLGSRYAGAITAAKFLQHFTNYQWIHLDIAGPAYLDNKDSYKGVGGTGYGVRLFYYFLKELIKQNIF